MRKLLILFFLSYTFNFGCAFVETNTCPTGVGLSEIVYSSSVIGCEKEKKLCEDGSCLALLGLVQTNRNPWDYEEGEELSGGRAMTSFVTDARAFLQFGKNSPLNTISDFTVGQAVFEVPWTAGFSANLPDRDGLGPFFHTNSCLGCHIGNGRAVEDDGDPLVFTLVRLGVGAKGNDPEPVYGTQFQPNAVAGVAPEGTVHFEYDTIDGKYQDGNTYSLRKPNLVFSGLGYGPLHPNHKTSVRLTQQVIGLGLLESVPEENILSRSDPMDLDGDGISGRPNWIWDLSGSGKSLGRFGWKANAPSLKRQNSAAFSGDIGITSPMLGSENCSSSQTSCANAIGGGKPEVSEDKVTAITKYMQLVAVPVRRNPNTTAILNGKKHFFQAGCHKCHTEKLVTGNQTPFAQLANQTIRPYTDLLLHDMGEALSDGKADGEATETEWRTAPLWGIGLLGTVNGKTRYLHDGRAKTLDEAILWHGGEAEKSKKYFLALNVSERASLIRFLLSL
ncbi:di-heme oxidoredictase family protein [Leptospira meyeri]|uniref:di-heme oxidoreductase family protein n=1 Tax=Leptospira meyeri TaxID=29508 RepID=UPI0002C03B75|nr:di-heme oxidoredictase family protein [Leptospira meyeri]EMJ87096.1 PF06537 domain protein [Leptospira meyeri serovar Semaranga str. Veldrot Semarang 173]